MSDQNIFENFNTTHLIIPFTLKMGRVRRGIVKMKTTWFKPKNELYSQRSDVECETQVTLAPRYVRPTHQQLELATTRDAQGNFCHTATQTAQQNCRNVMLLRPKVVEMTPVDEIQLKSMKPVPTSSGQLHPKSGADQHEGGYRFVNVKSAVELGSHAVLEHQRTHPECDSQPKLLAEAEEHRGLAVSEMMSCVKCGYKTEKTKLYSEIPHKTRGRRTATPNIAFQIGLQNTGIAASGARRLLTSMDTAVPSSSGLQKSANKCGQIIMNENIRDMADKRKLVKDIHQLQGFERESPIAVEIDRQYNNPLRNCRKKNPFVPATQTRDTVCENVTTSKYIIMYNHENKLCKSGEHSRALLGQKSRCPKHTGVCTATRPPHFNMGDEREGGVQSANKLLECEEPMLVNRITTDADGCLAQGMSASMTTKTGQQAECLLDPPHLNRSLCAAVSRAAFSEDTFPGNTKKEQKKAQDRFADDISHRAQAEANQI